LLLALPPPRGVLAPADCHQPAISHPQQQQQQTVSSAYSGALPLGNHLSGGVGGTSNYTTTAGRQQQHHHHHKLIHQRQLPTVPETI
jgi:hypothetical protein